MDRENNSTPIIYAIEKEKATEYQVYISEWKLIKLTSMLQLFLFTQFVNCFLFTHL